MYQKMVAWPTKTNKPNCQAILGNKSLKIEQCLLIFTTKTTKTMVDMNELSIKNKLSTKTPYIQIFALQNMYERGFN